MPRTSEEGPERAAGPGSHRASRRAFLTRASRGLGVLAVAGLEGAALSGCTPLPRRFPAPPGPVRVPLDRFPELEEPGGMIQVIQVYPSGQHPVYLRRGPGDTFEAISAVCTHQGCTVAPSGGSFRCPCHGSTYDRDGRNTGGPARRPLARYPATRSGAVVILSLPEDRGKS